MKKLVLSDQARIDLDDLDRATRLRVAAALQRHPPPQRLRVGDFRVRFSYLDPGTVRINHVQNRKDAYR